ELCISDWVEMRTMRREDSVGSKLTISESKFEGLEPTACVPGTNIMVKNIFFHMPARRKFLKKDSIELNHILREFERLALVNTNIDFTLIHNDQTLHKFMRGSLKQRIADLFGKNLESQLAQVYTETGIVTIDGFIAMPRAAKKRGYQQFLFVNGRNMRHPFFHKAVMSCYEQLIAPDAQPSYFINFTVDPATIDVNIHPQKHEIKFEHEQAIWQMLIAAVRETLGKTQAVGALDFDAVDAPEIPLFNPQAVPASIDDASPEAFNPFAADTESGQGITYASVPAGRGSRTAGSSYGSDRSFGTARVGKAAGDSGTWGSRSVSLGESNRQSVPEDWEKLYESFNDRRNDAFASVAVPADDSASLDIKSDAPAATCIQLQDRYIAMSSPGGLMLIEPHRAHVRILFEKYMEMLATDDAKPSQKLLFAVDFELSPSQSALLMANIDEFRRLGFEFTSAAEGMWSVQAVPAQLDSVNPIEVVLTVLESLANDADGGSETMRRPLAIAMARAWAVKVHQRLTQAEMDGITADLFRCAEPNYTPDGQPVMSLISNDEIASRFTL
ncbi:MAG: DNA mismatch repair endonuclease MutL, partial [Muribaculaceae bacterium]|nr:DNA mismatch repair endonuclease MutL [Muribaculaceae bacterium]